MNIDKIAIYPIKSARGIALHKSRVLPYGLKFDRSWALFDSDLKVITARDFPQLLKISAVARGDNLIVFNDEKQVMNVALKTNKKLNSLQVFKENATGYDTSSAAHRFFSSYLGVECFFVYMGNDHARKVLPKYGGNPQDVVSYADECPVLLISNASLQDLNERLENPVTMQHFRPNLTVEGCAAYEEDTWKKIRIGQCEFDVSQQCKRCVFVTIDPVTMKKSSQQEPLRTLAAYRKHPRGGVAFGVHLIPRRTGKISIEDEVRVIA